MTRGGGAGGGAPIHYLHYLPCPPRLPCPPCPPRCRCVRRVRTGALTETRVEVEIFLLTSAAVLTGRRRALVDVVGAVTSRAARHAVAPVGAGQVDARRALLTQRRRLAFVYVRLAMHSLPACTAGNTGLDGARRG